MSLVARGGRQGVTTHIVENLGPTPITVRDASTVEHTVEPGGYVICVPVEIRHGNGRAHYTVMPEYAEDGGRRVPKCVADGIFQTSGGCSMKRDWNRKAVVAIPLRILERALLLPEGSAVAMYVDSGWRTGDPDVLLVKIVSDELPEVTEGQVMPRAVLEYRSRPGRPDDAVPELVGVRVP